MRVTKNEKKLGGRQRRTSMLEVLVFFLNRENKSANRKGDHGGET